MQCLRDAPRVHLAAHNLQPRHSPDGGSHGRSHRSRLKEGLRAQEPRLVAIGRRLKPFTTTDIALVTAPDCSSQVGANLTSLDDWQAETRARKRPTASERELADGNWSQRCEYFRAQGVRPHWSSGNDDALIGPVPVFPVVHVQSSVAEQWPLPALTRPTALRSMAADLRHDGDETINVLNR
jgi:hypothetical protein